MKRINYLVMLAALEGLGLRQFRRENECIQTALVDECYAGFVGSALNRGSALVFLIYVGCQCILWFGIPQ